MVKASPLPALGTRVEVIIEVSRFSFTKRRPDGSVHFLSPLPTPFNYGSIPETNAEDGDPLDAIVLGRKLARGTRVTGRVWAVVDFIDHGVDDPKLVVGPRSPSLRERALLELFFRIYAPAKRLLDPGPGHTRFRGFRVP